MWPDIVDVFLDYCIPDCAEHGGEGEEGGHGHGDPRQGNAKHSEKE